ncbi:MAG: hypothetical protein COW04_12630 [Deltaproteobacteria bacterium CG12_big_fil_rev_8_21_14_0_65_43_10]|nr:MAG: hypothetical protein COW04_12630 [Deltaproteobacteria bacterium CG12_big_fil_rev_8_21_14_0_65_43_10]
MTKDIKGGVKMNTKARKEEYVGEVLSDGHLSLPESIRQKLSLKPSSVVKVVISLTGAETKSKTEAWKLFRSMGRTAAQGKLKNSAEEHDRYLYAKVSK